MSLGLGHDVRNAGVANLPFRAHQPLRHRRRWAPETRARSRPSRGRTACEASARPALPSASAGWQQVKISRSRSSGISPRRRSRARRSLRPSRKRHTIRVSPRNCVSPADAVDGLVPGRLDDPGARRIRDARSRATGRRPRQRLPAPHSSARSKSPTSRIRVATIRPQSER